MLPELTPLRVPGDAMVMLMGVSGSGKSTFAARHFGPTDVLSSDALRGLIAGDESDQSATEEAFELLRIALRMRLARGRLTVVDATNVQRWARRLLLDAARQHGRPAVAVVLDLPLAICLERNQLRLAHRPPASAIRRQHRWLVESMPMLAAEGFARVDLLRSPDEVERVVVEQVVERISGQRNAPKELRPPRRPKPPKRYRNA
jgi:protein phosphatase